MEGDQIEELRIALNDFDIGRAGKHFHKIFITYLQSEHENLPINFSEVLIDLEQLFSILDILEQWERPGISPS